MIGTPGHAAWLLSVAAHFRRHGAECIALGAITYGREEMARCRAFIAMARRENSANA